MSSVVLRELNVVSDLKTRAMKQKMEQIGCPIIIQDSLDYRSQLVPYYDRYGHPLQVQGQVGCYSDVLVCNLSSRDVDVVVKVDHGSPKARLEAKKFRPTVPESYSYSSSDSDKENGICPGDYEDRGFSSDSQSQTAVPLESRSLLHGFRSDPAYIQEAVIHWKLSKKISGLVPVLGLTENCDLILPLINMNTDYDATCPKTDLYSKDRNGKLVLVKRRNVQSSDLRSLLESGSRYVTDMYRTGAILSVIRDMAITMTQLHKEKVEHGDMHAGNIFVDQRIIIEHDGRIVAAPRGFISDFGCFDEGFRKRKQKNQFSSDFALFSGVLGEVQNMCPPSVLTSGLNFFNDDLLADLEQQAFKFYTGSETGDSCTLRTDQDFIDLLDGVLSTARVPDRYDGV